MSQNSDNLLKKRKAARKAAKAKANPQQQTTTSTFESIKIKRELLVKEMAIEEGKSLSMTNSEPKKYQRTNRIDESDGEDGEAVKKQENYKSVEARLMESVNDSVANDQFTNMNYGFGEVDNKQEYNKSPIHEKTSRSDSSRSIRQSLSQQNSRLPEIASKKYEEPVREYRPPIAKVNNYEPDRASYTQNRQPSQNSFKKLEANRMNQQINGSPVQNAYAQRSNQQNNLLRSQTPQKNMSNERFSDKPKTSKNLPRDDRQNTESLQSNYQQDDYQDWNTYDFGKTNSKTANQAPSYNEESMNRRGSQHQTQKPYQRNVTNHREQLSTMRQPEENNYGRSVNENSVNTKINPIVSSMNKSMAKYRFR